MQERDSSHSFLSVAMAAIGAGTSNKSECKVHRLPLPTGRKETLKASKNTHGQYLTVHQLSISGPICMVTLKAQLSG